MGAGESAVRPRLLLVANAGASRVEAGAAERAASFLGRRWTVSLHESDSPAATAEASRRAAAQGVDVVASLGGDGTARSVAEGIAGTDTALACLPGGSRNVFARMLGVPGDIDAAATRLAGRTSRRRVDLGSCAGGRFLFAASVGLSAEINERVNRRPRLKARLGAAYGAGTGVRAALTYLLRPPRMRLSAGRYQGEVISLIAQNSRPLTYVGARPLELCERVSLASGTISVAALRRLAPWDLVSIPTRLLLGRAAAATASRRVEEIAPLTRAKVSAASGEALPVDLDGDHLGSFETLELQVEPGALAVIEPRDARAGADGGRSR